MEIRHLNADDDRLAVSWIFEASWKYAYRYILTQEYLESILAGGWAAHLDSEGMTTLIMLEAAVSALAGQGYQEIFLWVLEENRRARAFYEKVDFRLYGKCRTDVIGGKAVRELAYCRHIP